MTSFDGRTRSLPPPAGHRRAPRRARRPAASAARPAGCPGPGLREGRPGRRRGARRDRVPGIENALAEDHVIALAGEKSARRQAQQGHLRGQRPLQPVPVAALGRSLPDRPGGQQLPDQPVPAQLGEPVLVVPHSRPGRDPGRQRIVTLAIGNTGRNGNGHGKMSGQRSSCGKRADSTPHVLPGASLHFPAFPCPLPDRDQPTTRTMKSDTTPQKSANLRAVLRRSCRPRTAQDGASC